MSTDKPHDGLVSAGVDWVTATTSDPSGLNTLAKDWHIWCEVAGKAGDVLKPDGKLGYKGYSIQNVFFGVREDGAMLVATGWAADIWYNIVYGAGWRVTRLDIQVTGVVNEGLEGLSEQLAAAAVEARGGGSGGRPRKVTRIQGYGDGDTVAIGSRSSGQFGRAYDKSAEAPGEYPAGSWRFEVEYKKEYAQAALEGIMSAPDAQAAVRGMVKRFYEARGVTVPFTLDGEAVDLHIEKVVTSDDKSLHWLEKHVRPTVDRLIKRGKRDDVLRVLGLTE